MSACRSIARWMAGAAVVAAASTAGEIHHCYLLVRIPGVLCSGCNSNSCNQECPNCTQVVLECTPLYALEPDDLNGKDWISPAVDYKPCFRCTSA